MLADVVAASTTAHGRTDEITIQALNELGEAYRVDRQWAAAESAFEEAVRLARGKWGGAETRPPCSSCTNWP